MSNLYTLNTKYRELMGRVMEADEITDDLMQEIHTGEENFEEEAINQAAMIKNMEVESVGIQKAMDDMQKRYISLSKKIVRFKSDLLNSMELQKTDAICTPLFDIKVRLNNPKVHIPDETLIPDQYWRELTTKKVDRLLIQRELKDNIAVHGASLIRDTRIEIK